MGTPLGEALCLWLFYGSGLTRVRTHALKQSLHHGLSACSVWEEVAWAKEIINKQKYLENQKWEWLAGDWLRYQFELCNLCDGAASSINGGWQGQTWRAVPITPTQESTPPKHLYIDWVTRWRPNGNLNIAVNHTCHRLLGMSNYGNLLY